jgi:hypothetical protein
VSAASTAEARFEHAIAEGAIAVVRAPEATVNRKLLYVARRMEHVLDIGVEVAVPPVARDRPAFT